MKSTRWFVTLVVALVMGASSAHGASKRKTHSLTPKNKVHQMVAPNGDIIESLIVTAAESPGCFLKYQRKHDKSDYNKNVRFNMMCCETSADPKKQCCGNKGGKAAEGFEIGCEPLLGDRKPWLTMAEAKKVSERSCEVGQQCQTTGFALEGTGGAMFGVGAKLMFGNFMAGSMCMVGGGGIVMAGAHLASHEEELRTCAKATDINFKPGQTYKISKGNIRDSAAMLRKIMEKAVLEEPYRVGNSFQEGAEHMKNNAEIMTTPAYEAGKRMIKEAEERTGTIIPQPLTPGSQQ